MCIIQNGRDKPFLWWFVKGCSIQWDDYNIWAHMWTHNKPYYAHAW